MSGAEGWTIGVDGQSVAAHDQKRSEALEIVRESDFAIVIGAKVGGGLRERFIAHINIPEGAGVDESVVRELARRFTVAFLNAAAAEIAQMLATIDEGEAA